MHEGSLAMWEPYPFQQESWKWFEIIDGCEERFREPLPLFVFYIIIFFLGDKSNKFCLDGRRNTSFPPLPSRKFEFSSPLVFLKSKIEILSTEMRSKINYVGRQERIMTTRVFKHARKSGSDLFLYLRRRRRGRHSPCFSCIYSSNTGGLLPKLTSTLQIA